MQIIEVKDKKTWKLFHAVPHRIYRGNPVWICPLEAEVEAVFTKEKNKAFLAGDAQCFVLLDGQGRPSGRIAVFVDHERNRKQPFPTGGVGFFECIDNEDYAYALFDVAVKYLSQWNVKAVDGPVNFGEREKFWGMLVKGHEYEPLHQENYQPEYYQRFFTAWGFQPFEQILTFLGVSDDVPIERFSAVAKRLKERVAITVKSPDMRNLKSLAHDFNVIYNSAFAKFEHFKPLSIEQTLKLFEDAKPIVDPLTSCFVYVGGKPAAFTVLLQEINHYLKPAKGKLRWWNILYLLYKLRFGRKRKLKGVAFGTHADYQRMGLFPVMVDYLYYTHKPSTVIVYPEFYLTTVRGHNKIMVDSMFKMGVKVQRVHVAYRKMLDPDAPFEPHSFLEV